MVEDGAKVLEFPTPKAVPPMPAVVPPKPKQPEEHYRVGFDSEGRTTLTLMADTGSMTLSMNQTACEQLIRMLRATYQDDDDTPENDPDGGLPLPEEERKAA